MPTRFWVAFLFIILLAGTLVRSVPSPRPPPLARHGHQNAQQERLAAQLKQFGKLFHAGHFHDAELLAGQGYHYAWRTHDMQMAGKFCDAMAACRYALHQDREALRIFLEARSLAESAGDPVTAGIADFNIASLYAHLGQLDAATQALERAMARLSGPKRQAEMPRLLDFLASLQGEQGRLAPAVDTFGKGIAAGDAANDPELRALGWNGLGYVYLDHALIEKAQHPLVAGGAVSYPELRALGWNELGYVYLDPALIEHALIEHAEHPFLEGYLIRKLNHLRTAESSYENLGVLRVEQGDIAAASTLLDKAVALSKEPGGLRPPWEVYYARGAVRMRQNRLPEALEDLRNAARLAEDWRRNAFPDDATRIGVENKIQKVYAALVETGNRLYFRKHRTALVEETFEAAEANRAAGLRTLLAEPPDWRNKLPSAYWETLRQLELAEADLLRSPKTNAPVSEQVRRLRGQLVEWESQAGSAVGGTPPDLLERTEQRLAPDTALFAFHLGSPNSYVWTVSRENFALYRLPAEPEIAAEGTAFNEGIRKGNARAGQRIFQILFGQASPVFARKSRWLLALDTQLFELPFAAMTVDTRGRTPVFLAERHSIQIISSAASLLQAEPRPLGEGPFMGVADPVYNTADSRWKGPRNDSFLDFFTARASEPQSGDLNLPRLAASAREVRMCAAAWGGSYRPTLLEGSAASSQGIAAAVKAHPAILHFATHVLRPGTGGSGFIVLSLTPARRYEVAGPAEIATWNLGGAIVSLSGCGSGAAQTLPATGLMGLTRACQAAGARAVVASHWATPDDEGALFLAFYRYLRAAPADGPAVALERAQIDMLRSNTWRRSPLYWGAYFVTGNQL